MEIKLNQSLQESLQGKAAILVQLMLDDIEMQTLQEYANMVSTRRLGFNDHGPVHMRKTAINAIKIVKLLSMADIPLSLQLEEIGIEEDSICAILLASLLHDCGMTIARSLHEQTVLPLVYPIITRLLDEVYGDNPQKYVVRSLAMECMLGHMASVPINSREAGVLLVADGCDMTKGRARPPLVWAKSHGITQRVGDIHQHSALAIDYVEIGVGEHKPICIDVMMNSSTGFFQVEEILIRKLRKSPIKEFVGVRAYVLDADPVNYVID
jgi:metal-dependent HD superfamily phosphatase/phosphodiesterase